LISKKSSHSETALSNEPKLGRSIHGRFSIKIAHFGSDPLTNMAGKAVLEIDQ
jgi:hypothetical protein